MYSKKHSSLSVFINPDYSQVSVFNNLSGAKLPIVVELLNNGQGIKTDEPRTEVIIKILND